MIYSQDPQSAKLAFVLNKPPDVLLDWQTVSSEPVIINRYYGERIKYSYSIYYAIKYGKHFHFKIRNCKHNYKPKDITKEVEDFIYKMGVFKLG